MIGWGFGLRKREMSPFPYGRRVPVINFIGSVCKARFSMDCIIISNAKATCESKSVVLCMWELVESDLYFLKIFFFTYIFQIFMLVLFGRVNFSKLTVVWTKNLPVLFARPVIAYVLICMSLFCMASLIEVGMFSTWTLRIRKALENRTNMEDDRVAILEAQLAQAKLIAEEADKKYEEVILQFVTNAWAKKVEARWRKRVFVNLVICFLTLSLVTNSLVFRCRVIHPSSFKDRKSYCLARCPWFLPF